MNYQLKKFFTDQKVIGDRLTTTNNVSRIHGLLG